MILVMALLLLLPLKAAAEDSPGNTQAGPTVAAASSMSTPPKNSLTGNGPYVIDSKSPQVQSTVLQGTLISMDTVFQRLTVQSDSGNVQEFPITSNIPILYHFAQIKFQTLQPGDRVAVTYNALPFQVTRVDKL
jgi:hypothetical protein